MRSKILGGFCINLVVFLVLGSALNTAGFFLAWRPAWNYLTEHLPVAWDWLAGVLVGFSAVAFLMLSLVFAFRFSIRLMGVWYEGMVELVVDYFHPGAPRAEGGVGLREFGRSLSRELLLLGTILLLGLIPLIGGVGVFYFSCSLMGYSVFEPYLSVLQAHHWQEQAPRLKRWSLRLFLLGVPQLLIALIPLAGWFLLPWVMLRLVLGQSWIYAQALTPPPPAQRGSQ